MANATPPIIRSRFPFSVDNGPKVYIERIDIVGNTRTRDFVIRREFDIGEGDPYNHVLIERAERRLNSLGYFKKVHISNRPGSSPDRVIVVVDVEDQPTGSISLSGGYSTTQGFLAELAYTETNFLGRGQYVRLSVSDGQYTQGGRPRSPSLTSSASAWPLALTFTIRSTTTTSSRSTRTGRRAERCGSAFRLLTT